MAYVPWVHQAGESWEHGCGEKGTYLVDKVP